MKGIFVDLETWYNSAIQYGVSIVGNKQKDRGSRFISPQSRSKKTLNWIADTDVSKTQPLCIDSMLLQSHWRPLLVMGLGQQ